MIGILNGVYSSGQVWRSYFINKDDIEFKDKYTFVLEDHVFKIIKFDNKFDGRAVARSRCEVCGCTILLTGVKKNFNKNPYFDLRLPLDLTKLQECAEWRKTKIGRTWLMTKVLK